MITRFFFNTSKCALLPMSSLFGEDKLDNVTETEKNADMSVMKQETGWDRVKRMFSIDDLGNLTREANSIMQVAALSTFIGAMYGGVINSRHAYLEFMRNNEVTSFRSHLEAKQKLQEKVTISFGKGAWKWGWRLTLFCTTYVSICTTIQVYRGKCGFIEYVSAGALAGTMYKFNMGPRGWIVGGGLGASLGFICGGLTLGILKLTGISMEEARYWQFHYQNTRSEYFRKGVGEYLEKEDFAVIKIHNDQVGEKGKNIKVLK